MARITKQNLMQIAARINQALGVPNEVYQQDAQGNFVRNSQGHLVANVGTVYLSEAFGGVRFEQVACEDGGVRDLFHGGYLSKREAYDMARAYLQGLESR